MRGQLIALLASLLVACTGEDPGETKPPEPPPVDDCEAPAQLLPDGACEVVGIAPESCAPGFETDEANGCRPVLPLEACPPGQLAVPGDRECAPLADCGSGTWGNIPVDETTQFVDQSFGGASDGSETAPWPTILEAFEAASPGALIAIAAGTYPEYLNLQGKAVRLWGVCPSLVEVRPNASDPRAMLIADARGLEVHNLAFTSPVEGVALSAAPEALFEGVWIHDIAGRGLGIESVFDHASVTLRRSIIEQTVEYGAFVQGTELMVEQSAIRDVRADEDGRGGWAISVVTDHEMVGSTVTIRDSVIRRTLDAGVIASGSELTVERTAITDLSTGSYGEVRHLSYQSEATQVSSGAVRDCFLGGPMSVGVYVAGSVVSIERTTFAPTSFIAPDVSPRPLNLTVQHSDMLRSSLTLSSSMLRRPAGLGMYVNGSDVTVDRSAFVATDRENSLLDISVVAVTPVELVETGLALTRVLIDGGRDVGLGAFGSRVSVAGTIIEGITPTVGGTYGDGIDVLSYVDAPGTLSVTGSRIAATARAGVASFSGEAILRDVHFDCIALPLNGQDVGQGSFDIRDEGGNRCGCDGEETVCRVLTGDLAAPEPPEPPTAP